MNSEQKLTDEEFRQMAKLLYRYAEYELDQFDHFKFDTSYGKVFITISRKSGGYDNSFDDLINIARGEENKTEPDQSAKVASRRGCWLALDQKNMDYQKLYSNLFAEAVKQHGKLDEETLNSIVGFSGGGPVSLSKIEEKNLFVTCELAAYEEQVKSSEGLKYELLSRGNRSAEWCHAVFTSLGAMSMDTELGDGHSIDISAISPEEEYASRVELKLFSRSSYEGVDYGVYEVIPS